MLFSKKNKNKEQLTQVFSLQKKGGNLLQPLWYCHEQNEGFENKMQVTICINHYRKTVEVHKLKWLKIQKQNYIKYAHLLL